MAFLPDLELNLSFVLHERSTSESVRRVASLCRRHAGQIHAVQLDRRRDLVLDGEWFEPDLWIAPALGYPHLLPGALARNGSLSPEIITVDDGDGDAERSFFRAPASLRLNRTSSGITGVAALVARPAGGGAQLILRGPFTLPDDLSLALRELESLIQSYADQWMPTRALWGAPAERLLGDEVR